MTKPLHFIVNPKVPLRLILVVPFVVQVVVAVGLVGYLSFRNGQRAVENLASQLRNEITAHIKDRLDTYLSTPHLINQINADDVHLGKLKLQNTRSLEHHFWKQIQLFDSATYIYFGSEQEVFTGVERTPDGTFNIGYWSSNSPNGKFYTYATNSQGDRTQELSAIPNYNMLIRPWYRTAARVGKPTWGDIYVWAAPYPNIALPAVLPIYNPTGDLQGVFAVDLSLLDIGHFLSTLKVGKTGQTFIMGRDGLLVASSTPEASFISETDEPKRLQATQVDDLLIQSTANHLLKEFNRFSQIEQQQQLTFKLNNKQQLVQVTPYQDEFGLDWLIVVVVPEADFMAQIHANTRTTILLCFAAFVVATGVGIVTSRWITQPILELGEASRNMASGELDQTVEKYDDTPLQINELKLLAESFNQMARQLSKSFTDLEKLNDELEEKVDERTVQLVNAEAELRGLFEAMTELIFVKDRQGRYLKIVSASPELLAKAADEMLGKTDYELLPAEQAEQFVGYIQRTLTSQKTVNVEYSLTLPEQTAWFSASISPISANRVIWVARDITDRKRAEEALREKEEYLRLILDNIPQQVFLKDTNSVFLGCNRNWAKAAQLESPEAVVGLTDYDLLPKAVADALRAKDRQIMEADQPEFHHIDVKQKLGEDGQKCWLDINKIPIHDSQGKVIGILGVIEDITQRKQAEESLRVEQEKSEQLLLNILPKLIAERLKQDTSAIAEQFDETTIMFADIVGFTPLSAKMHPTELVKLLNQVFSLFDQLAYQHGLEKIKTIGDAYMVVGGLPVAMANHAEAIANMALEMQEAISRFQADIGESFQIRIGINTGTVVAGVIGINKFIYDLWGDAVNVASRMESSGVPGKIQVTTQTYERLKDKFVFEERGAITVKGKGEMMTYWLIGRS
ncbi:MULTISPECIES: adenylate/guanylate cyclase domain-containing protein [unclassified Coleofasciculus]|uniref:adenylate/guanylate cyclase domain-containing protein n=1 Tax=unclassified Coleofasciculus TaxID=2692782 RepID=UPI0018816CD9|nr:MULTISPECIES: adenylate/guanylate cyclase domain-containing protein [unclassified Coleofasciculus]MBE9129581.1 PAS domain-containing protein [Coleofasciculus sp. LEGE 07081]MBE9148261.1 PAS domain-containing protein [Coleofasciculus sp. LEGE 07092]